MGRTRVRLRQVKIFRQIVSSESDCARKGPVVGVGVCLSTIKPTSLPSVCVVFLISCDARKAQLLSSADPAALPPLVVYKWTYVAAVEAVDFRSVCSFAMYVECSTDTLARAY